jgi:hypothetical protein
LSFLGRRVEEFGATCENEDDEGCGSSWLIVEVGVERRSFSTVDGSRTTVFLVGPPGGLAESLDFLVFPFHGRRFGCGPHPEVEVDDGLFSEFCFFFPSDFVMVKIG